MPRSAIEFETAIVTGSRTAVRGRCSIVERRCIDGRGGLLEGMVYRPHRVRSITAETEAGEHRLETSECTSTHRVSSREVVATGDSNTRSQNRGRPFEPAERTVLVTLRVFTASQSTPLSHPEPTSQPTPLSHPEPASQPRSASQPIPASQPRLASQPIPASQPTSASQPIPVPHPTLTSFSRPMQRRSDRRLRE